MITKTFDKYELICDICGEAAEEEFIDFYDAVEYKRQNRWRSIKEQGEWKDVCPECQG